VFIASGRAPFDLPEAESELISGSLTELASVGFTFSYLADLFEMLLIILWLIGLQATGGMSTIMALAVILSTYLGRIILVRLHQADLSRLIFLVLIWYLTGWFCLFHRPRLDFPILITPFID
jgi:NADH:ubiquinone oxidoreductase subunit H